MWISPPALWVLNTLLHHGYDSYVVGGCVRDSLLKHTPTDWDICTSANPIEILSVFEEADVKIIQTGIAHGTVTILRRRQAVDVTSFRVDGPYLDNRRPSHVAFTGSLHADLLRRDFTINAMAYSPQKGLIDLFGGQEDLRRGVLRCVGNPDVRFAEDALRILRALRFASKLGFQIEASLAKSIHHNKERLSSIAPERIFAELNSLLCGKAVGAVLLHYPNVLAVFLPEILPVPELLQNDSHHEDTWAHTATAVGHVSPRPVLRLAVLFACAGRPLCHLQDDNCTGDFSKHAVHSAIVATNALRRLRADKATIRAVACLIKWHDEPVTPALLPHRLHQLGEGTLRDLLQVKRACVLAAAPSPTSAHLAELTELGKKLDELIRQGGCFQLKDLAIDGHDVIQLGCQPGPRVGQILHTLLNQVLEGTLANQKSDLLQKSKKLLEHDVI